MDRALRQERLDWVDTARGLGIILVVYGHALRGHVTSGAFDVGWLADVQDGVIYSFHMPLFFFLAGLFAQRSLTKGAPAFVRDKLVTLVYPYFLWSAISVALAVMAGGNVNNAMQPSAIRDLWLTPVYQYWFLYALIIIQMLALLTRANPWLTALLCVVSAFGWGTGGLGMVTIGFSFYVYFGIGILLAPLLAAVEAQRGPVAAAVVIAVIGFVLLFAVGDLWSGRLLSLARATLGIIATVGLAMLCGRRFEWLRLLGMASMAIYVLHTIFSAGTRIACRMLNFSDNLTALIFGTITGLAGPLAVWAIARHYGLLPWLGLGAQPREAQKVDA